MTPNIYNITAFDASFDKTIEFAYRGNQAFSNTLTIRNNYTNSIVYRQETSTMQLKHTIPSGTLQNGILYNATISVKDRENISSGESTPILFYCFTTPTFNFENIVDEQNIQNSSYQVSLMYRQIQNEELQFFQIGLYNDNKNQIWSSGVKYDTTNMSIMLTDLEDNSSYYIRATGATINGMELDTGYLHIVIDYITPSVYAIITLENQKETGSVLVRSNIVSLEGRYEGETDNPTYIENEFIDLINPNNKVIFDEGFTVPKNFTLNIKGYNFADFSTILQLSNGDKTINLYKKRGTYESENNVEKNYFELRVPGGLSYYIIHSNYIDVPDKSDILSVWIKRIDNIYSVYVENLSTKLEE